jgi:hypothetical protein
LIGHKNIHKLIYRKFLPRLWQDKVDLIRGESQVFRPCFQETKSIFIHIPKAAGTSIARSIYGMNVGHRKASDYIAISDSEFKKYYRFSFVRNPWDRAISAYNFVKQGGTSLVQPLPNNIYKSSMFDTFDTFLTEWLQHQDLGEIDVVFEPQYKYIFDYDENLLVDFVGKIENIEIDLKKIESKINRKIEMKNLNKSNRTTNPYHSEYTNESFEIISKIYAKDIALFNYDF